MNDDYLWDKSGEPDPQIQQLEEILGTLRYQPKPLQLPRALSSARRRNYFPLLAIAATVVLALLAGALWLQSLNREASIPTVAIATPDAPIPRPVLSPLPDSPKKRTPVLTRPVSIKGNQKEALAAKQQLMFALRLASEKLNSVHRRTQDKRSSYEDTLPN